MAERACFSENMLCFHGYISFLTIFVVHDLKAALALSLSRDTLRTINSNETCDEGYYISRYTGLKQCYYSASSPVGLTRLAQGEMQIYEALSDAKKCIVARNDSFPQIVQEYLEDYEDTSGVLMRSHRLKNVKNKAEVPAGDLIGAYRMVRRFRNYIQLDLFQAMSSYNASLYCETKSLSTIDNLRPNATMGPFKRDFQLTMFAIIFTQLQLDWTPMDISQGRIKGMELGTSLKAVHCVEIGVHAVATRFFPVGIEWLELAVTKIQNGDQTVDFNFALSLLQKSVTEHDKSWQPITDRDLPQVFYKTRLNTSMEKPDREWPREFEANGRWFDDELYTDVSWEVCSGKIRQTEAEKSKLFCWHETKVHPTWRLGPLKAELLARHPFEVVQFHQVLQDRIMERIKNDCADRLVTSNLYDEARILSPKYRLSELSYIREKRLQNLAERIVGLKTDYSYEMPVVSHAPGGHIRLHMDNVEGEQFEQRIATLIYSFDEPHIGGETVIPATKVLAKPIKGSAILFYNLLQSSKFNVNAKHGGCVMVQGQKWIGTIWITYDLQLQLKCDRNEDSMMEYFVNGNSKYNSL